MSTVNFFKANNQFRSQHVKYTPPRPCCNHNKTVNVNIQPGPPMPTLQPGPMPTLQPPTIVQENVVIQNGPKNGTQAFLGAFSGSLLGGILGNVIGGGKETTTVPKDTSETGVDHFKNLKTLFPNHVFVKEENGQYTCRTPEGKLFTGTYEEIKNWLKEPSQGVTTPPSDTPDDNTVTTPDDDTPSVTDIDTPHARKPSGGGGTSKVKVPSGWYRANNGGEGNIKGLLKEGSTPRQVLDKVLQSKCDYLTESDRNALAKELEKCNPSIFKDGKVKAGADLSKLDIPSVDYIKNNYAKDTKKVGNGRVSYTGNDGKTHTGTSGINANKGTKTARGANGYTATYDKNGATYFKPDGTPTTAADFKQHCPNIYKQIQNNMKSM